MTTLQIFSQKEQTNVIIKEKKLSPRQRKTNGILIELSSRLKCARIGSSEGGASTANAVNLLMVMSMSRIKRSLQMNFTSRAHARAFTKGKLASVYMGTAVNLSMRTGA